MTAGRRPAVFLDRDGVLNVDKGFVYRVADFEWILGAQEAVKYANDKGMLVIVVTNQSGIARGFYNEADMQKLHAWMSAQLAEQNARIDGFYHCPFHAEGVVERYRRASELRKPAPGMILQAISDWNVDTQRSFLIGDKKEDLMAASGAGIPGYLMDIASLYDLMVRCIDDVVWDQTRT